MKKFPFLTVGFALVAWAVHLFPEWTAALEFSRPRLADGQLGRLLTAHWTHFSADHLKWDVVVFVALGSLVELRSRGRFLFCIGGAAALVSAGVWLLQPEFDSYRGLSGVDCALFGFLAADIGQLSAREKRPWLVAAVAVAFILFFGKIFWELATGTPLFVESGNFTPVPLAHLLGGLAGTAVALVGKKVAPVSAGSSMTAAESAPG